MQINIVIIVILFFGTSTSEDEATVETEEFYNSVQDDQSPRSGRLFWSEFNHPTTNMIVEVAASFYGPHTKDFFRFLRDSYSLPGGLTEPYSEYDFIIIGAGSAGCALANRLSKNRNITVLLLEVGKTEQLVTDIPAIAPYFQSTDYAWDYYMEPQTGVCMGMENERCYWPRGKAVGGTSVINYMIYTRGRPQDWDRIAADGNYGWSYKDVLKYYIELEKSYLNGLEKVPHRGRDGDLPVEFISYKTKLREAFLDAGVVLGHPTVDYNAPDKFGFGSVQATISRGHRQSAAKVFLHTHKNRRNLHILPETRATKILINQETKTAYGIEYVRNNALHTVRARKEVILSAGPIASPQLLMLSGMGPRDHLTSLGIPVIENLPVGKVLYDHISFPALIFTLNETNLSLIENKITDFPHILDWLKNGDNVFSSPGGVEAIGYIKTPLSDDPDPTVPDIELISIGGSFLSDGGKGGSRAIRRGMRISESLINDAFGPIDGTDTWSAIPMLLHPKSVGRIELKDSNPYSNPKMYGNYLTDKKDVATFVASIRHIQKLVQTPPFQRYGAKLYPGHLKTCRQFTFDTDDYWECAVRTVTATLHHQISSCRMGPDNDPMAVLDPELRVRGIKKLRVVDTSVIPRTTSAHTNGPGMMIGLKAADMIRKSWNI
ncbi:glucose dehydrogenase [FAD, quinone] [Pieris rapae]|uniref:glucose dehydrogenase [FAD, quinone] n=1 Tax=Pieris rapae TaxID=64459 RepID=UPI001E279E6A|nr:glucose dehydrogenase [FAD, quinone] [Pieris rapae]